MTIEQLAADDFAQIVETAEAILKVSGTFDETGIACLVDGSMYSPSTRALTGGTHAYYIEDEGESMTRYHWTLDALTDAWQGERDSYMYWEDGCLWLSNRTHDDA